MQPQWEGAPIQKEGGQNNFRRMEEGAHYIYLQIYNIFLQIYHIFLQIWQIALQSFVDQKEKKYQNIECYLRFLFQCFVADLFFLRG